MGSFLFKWPHPEANEVYVTGTFDDWGKTERLNKVGDTFQKVVHLPNPSEKVLYKFVVDGNWTTDHTAPQEDDGHRNVNNILKPEDIKKHSSQAAEGEAAGTARGAAGGGLLASLLSSAHPDSSSAQLAGQVPKEAKKPSPTVDESSNAAPSGGGLLASLFSSAHPDSSSAQLAGQVPKEAKKPSPTVDESSSAAPSGGGLLASLFSSAHPDSSSAQLAGRVPKEGKEPSPTAEEPSSAASSGGGAIATMLSNVKPDSSSAKLAAPIPKETDKPGPTVEELTSAAPSGGGLVAAIVSSVHPDTNSAKLTGQVPKKADATGPGAEEPHGAALPGAFPETPSQDPPSDVPPLETETSPPGAFPETPLKELESFSTNPMPASPEARNPASGPTDENLPDHQDVTGNNVDSDVTTSQQDHEKDASSVRTEQKSPNNADEDGATASERENSSSAFPEEKSTGDTDVSNVANTQEDYDKDASSAFPEEKPNSNANEPRATASHGQEGSSDLREEKSTINTDGANAPTRQESFDKEASSALPAEKSYGVSPIPASSGPGNPISAPAGQELPEQEGIAGADVESHVTTSKEDYEKDVDSALAEERSFAGTQIPASSAIGIPISAPTGEELPDQEDIVGTDADFRVTTSKEDYGRGADSALPDEKSFGVTPIPASSGTGNPISIPTGEELPEHEAITRSKVDSNVTMSKEDYERRTRSAAPENLYGVDPIPASAGIGNPVSVPAGDSVEQHKTLLSGSLYTTVTTSQEDYEKAGSAPMPVGAASNGAAGPKDSASFVPDLTKDMIPESSLPMLGDSEDMTDIGPFIQSAGPGTTTAALAGQTPLEPRSEAIVVEDETPSATVPGPAPDVPEVVRESLSQAHESPEAAGSPEAVEGKKEVENELLREVKATDATAEPAPAVTAATSAIAPLPTAIGSKALEPAKEAEKEPEGLVENETESSTEISPLGKQSNDTAPAPSSPIVTTGVGESNTSTVSTPQKAVTPASSAASSPATSNGGKDKKKKRTSIFGRLKERLNR